MIGSRNTVVDDDGVVAAAVEGAAARAGGIMGAPSSTPNGLRNGGAAVGLVLRGARDLGATTASGHRRIA